MAKLVDRAGGLAQVIECLPSKPSKHEALSSNSSIPQKKLKKKNQLGVEHWSLSYFRS
jgi:hypothetical protein